MTAELGLNLSPKQVLDPVVDLFSTLDLRNAFGAIETAEMTQPLLVVLRREPNLIPNWTGLLVHLAFICSLGSIKMLFWSLLDLLEGSNEVIYSKYSREETGD